MAGMVTASMSGKEALLARLEAMANLGGMVKAGVLEGAKTADGKSVLDYAPIQEFGGQIKVTDKMRGFLAVNYGIHLRKDTTHITIPPRSFLRSTYQKHKREWFDIVARAIKAGKGELALEYAGIRMQDDIIQTIQGNMPPPNSAMTTMIKQKVAPAAVGKTLMQTGTLVHSINYEVQS